MNEAPDIYIVNLPPEARELLADNGIDLVTTLREEGLEVSRGPRPEDVPLPEGRKDVVLVLMATGLTASMIATGIAKVLDAIGRNRKFLVSEKKRVPVLDGTGKVVTDAAGAPLLYWTEVPRVIESTQTVQDKSTISAKVPTLLEFTVKSGR
jgi:hypothetical protein